MLKKNKDFFKILRSKILIAPSKKKEEEFWLKFQAEFGSGQKDLKLLSSNFYSLFFRIGLPTVATVLAFLIFWPNSDNFIDSPEVYAIIQDHELYSNLDFFIEIDDIELDDAEWEILLSEG